MNHARPRLISNSAYWVAGCELGWAFLTDIEEQVDVKNSQEVPARGSDCQSCCEGFFCLSSISCMIPCPLGAHCPLATLNKTTDILTEQLRDNQIIVVVVNIYGLMHGPTRRCSVLRVPIVQRIQWNDLAAVGDQLLTILERRFRKSREAAVRNVREKTQVHARWKSAKDDAVKHVAELHAHISGRFSKRMPSNPEEFKILNEIKTEMSDDLYFVAAVEKVGVASVLSHIFTEGGASFELLECIELPGVLALEKSIPVAA